MAPARPETYLEPLPPLGSRCRGDSGETGPPAIAQRLSDRFGRKRMYIIGIATIGVFTFAYFALLNTAIPAVIFVAVILSFIPHDMAYGPQGERHGTLAAFLEPRRAVAARRPHPRPF